MNARLAVLALALAMAASVQAQEPARPIVTVGWIEAPEIDGEIGVEEWEGATGVGAFAELGGGLTSACPSCLIAADEEGLVLACGDSGTPRPQQRGRDGALWLDDAFEFFVQPMGSAEYYQVIVSPAGEVADFRGRTRHGTRTFRPPHLPRRRPHVEMRILWSDLGREPEPGEVWRVNSRDIAEAGRLRAPVKSNFHEPRHLANCAAADARRRGAQDPGTQDHRLLIDAQGEEPR